MMAFVFKGHSVRRTVRALSGLAVALGLSAMVVAQTQGQVQVNEHTVSPINEP